MKTIRYRLPLDYDNYEQIYKLHTETILANYPVILPVDTLFYHSYAGLQKVVEYDVDTFTIVCKLVINKFSLKEKGVFSLPLKALNGLGNFCKLYSLGRTSENGKKFYSVDSFFIPILLPLGAQFYTNTGLYKVISYNSEFEFDHPYNPRKEAKEWTPDLGVDKLKVIVCSRLKTTTELKTETPQSALLMIDEEYNSGHGYPYTSPDISGENGQRLYISKGNIMKELPS